MKFHARAVKSALAATHNGLCFGLPASCFLLKNEIESKKKEFSPVFDSRNCVRAGLFSWRFITTSAPARVGFVFSRQCGSSVLRHRFKRRFREIVRLNGTQTPLHIVITPHKSLARITDDEWKNHKTRFENFLKQYAT